MFIFAAFNLLSCFSKESQLRNTGAFRMLHNTIPCHIRKSAIIHLDVWINTTPVMLFVTINIETTTLRLFDVIYKEKVYLHNQFLVLRGWNFPREISMGAHNVYKLDMGCFCKHSNVLKEYRLLRQASDASQEHIDLAFQISFDICVYVKCT